MTRRTHVVLLTSYSSKILHTFDYNYSDSRRQALLLDRVCVLCENACLASASEDSVPVSGIDELAASERLLASGSAWCLLAVV